MGSWFKEWQEGRKNSTGCGTVKPYSNS